MLPSVATWSFWIAAFACAVGQVAILRDTVGPREPADTLSETDLDRIASPSTVPPEAASGLAPAVAPAVARRNPGRLHAAGEVFWAVLPGFALVLVLLWTWNVMHADRRVSIRSDPVAAARVVGGR